jgi:hypothetical protein
MRKIGTRGMNSSPMPRVEPPIAIPVMRTMVSTFHDDRRRLRTAPSTAGMVPVACRIPKTPPTMKTKKMMSAALTIPRGMALRNPSRLTGLAIPSTSSWNTMPLAVICFGRVS